MKTKYYLGIVARGMAMGAADVVPGVSGGTIAFITGIYDKLINSISSFNLGIIKVLKNQGVKAVWETINGNFLVALFFGIGVSVVSLSKVFSTLIQTHPTQLWSFFFGLIIASIFYIGKQINKWSVYNVIGLIIGTAIVVGISLLPPIGDSDSLGYIFICGAIAICAMILPGISGSFLLLILGVYPTILGAVNDKNIVLLSVFGLGMVVGILSFSKLLKWIFEHYKNITLSILTGFLVGSMYKLWPWRHIEQIYLKHAGELNEEVVTLVDSPVLPQNYDEIVTSGNQILEYIPAESNVVMCSILAVLGFSLIFIVEFVGKKSGKE